MPHKVLIYLENDNNNLVPVALQLISKVQELTNNFSDFETVGIIVCAKDFDDNTLLQIGLNKVIKCELQNPTKYSSSEYADFISNVIEKEQADIVLFGATSQGRELAPRIAATLKTGLTADCSELDITKDAKLIATRPTFGGTLMAQILSKTLPQMATVRPNVFKQNTLNDNTETTIDKILFENTSNTEIIETILKDNSIYDLSNAQIILSGGTGLRNKENFELLKQLANKLNAQTGATRKAIEKGIAEKKYQIGQTGQTVAPKLYFAFGISGAIQHMSGVENAQTIIAINPDKTAPIHKQADYSIYEDATSFIKNWINQ